MIGIRPATATFLDFRRHRAGYHITAGQIFSIGCIARHKTLAVLVHQITALAAHTLGNQYTCTVHTGGMELKEFHVFQRYAGTRCHAQAVAGIDKGIGAGGKDTPCSAGGKQGGTRLQHHHFTCFNFHCGDTEDIAIFITDQIQRHPFDKEIGIGFDILLIQGMQQRMAGAVGSGTGAWYRRFAVVLHMAAKRTLVNLAVIQPVKRHAVMLEFIYHFSRIAAHILNRILIAEIVRAFHGVIHMPVPIVLVDIAE